MGLQNLDIWYDVSESFGGTNPNKFFVRAGVEEAIANIVQIQGGWVTVPFMRTCII